MYRITPAAIRAFVLLLVLAIGPLKAQDLFACLMMDGLPKSECCCGGHAQAQDQGNAEDAPDPAATGSNCCCERSVSVSLDLEARESATAVKFAELKWGTDPPVALPSSFDAFGIRQLADGAVLFAHHPPKAENGRQIYLLTQRLRI